MEKPTSLKIIDNILKLLWAAFFLVLIYLFFKHGAFVGVFLVAYCLAFFIPLLLLVYLGRLIISHTIKPSNITVSISPNIRLNNMNKSILILKEISIVFGLLLLTLLFSPALSKLFGIQSEFLESVSRLHDTVLVSILFYSWIIPFILWFALSLYQSIQTRKTQNISAK